MFYVVISNISNHFYASSVIHEEFSKCFSNESKVIKKEGQRFKPQAAGSPE